MWTTFVQKPLEDIGAEIGRDEMGYPLYVTIPTGADAEAIEIMTQGDGKALDLWLFSWDRTGGLVKEIELGTATDVVQAVEMARAAWNTRRAEMDVENAELEECN